MEGIEDVVRRLEELKAKRIFVQFGEGLKLKIQDISKKLEKEGFDTIICTEPCYGSCDIRDVESARLGCDVILHIGHEKFFESKIPVVFWEYFIDINPIPTLVKELGKLKDYKNIGLITSIQFVKTIPEVKKFLEMHGKKVFVNKTLQYEGQVLGCRLDAAKAVEKNVDCFLCISAGKFYGLGVVLVTEKPVLCLDLERSEIYSLEDFRKKIKKIIAWNKAQLKDAKKVGILVSWKEGQILYDSFNIKEKLEKKGKEIFILSMDEITPEKLEGLKLDFLINCACPRIGIDDISRYKIPIVNWDQLEKETA